MTFENDIFEAAEVCLAEFGTAATLVTIVRTYDPTTGLASTTETSTSVLASPPVPLKVGEYRETTIPEAMTWSFLEATGLPAAPKLHDRLTIAGASWPVLGFDTYRVGANPVAYRLFLGA